jgi:SAM-dependent methyltransferase
MTSCRSCRSRRLYLFLKLGDHPLANGFLREDQLDEPEMRFPLDVYACLDCGLIQVADQVPPDFFRHYVYIPSSAEAMHGHFAALADDVAERFPGSVEALTVDIGCNDGLFLSFLNAKRARTLGVDPAGNIAELARERGVEVVNEYFTPELARQIRDEHGPAAVVVTTNTFHHIGDLDPFTLGVTLLLRDDGVFIVEVPHALELVARNQFDGVYHEHVSQHTLKSFVDHFRPFGLEVFDVEALDVHGGSMRVFARRAVGRGDGSPVVREWLHREHDQGLLQAATYDAFRDRVVQNRDALLALLDDLKSAGRRIVGYGASARGNTLLNYHGIGPETLDYIVDRNPLKQGLYSPGMHIRVEGVERLVEDEPDYVLLIAWNFGDEIMRQQDDYRRRGGRFIVPIPEPEVVG